MRQKRRISHFLIVVLLIFTAQGCDTPTNSPAASSRAVRTERTLVVIVPGTYGNDEQWPMLLLDHQTFASELARGLRGDVEIHPQLWSSSIFGMRRIEAAQMLSDDIDCMSADYDRVVLVGHSHGGNIALLAASLCRTRIDSIVCLATPHVYLRVVDGEHTDLNLPIYCSPQTLRNTGRILCYCAEGDMVTDAWSNALLTGVSEMEAIELTREWRMLAGSPRLADDGFVLRLLESDNLFASSRLTFAVHNEVIPCDVRDALGIRQHHAIHSCEVGFAVGNVLSDHTSEELRIDRIVEDTDVGVR